MEQDHSNYLYKELITVIIPSFNEGIFLRSLLKQLNLYNFEHVTVVECGLKNNNEKLCNKYNYTFLYSNIINRAHQLNLGAEIAKTDFLLFLHADITLPPNFLRVLSFIDFQEFYFGNFSIRFSNNHWFLKLNQQFSKLKNNAFQFGDQGLLVQKRIFEQINGYRTELLFMEGNDLIYRLKKKCQFQKIPVEITVSARKYEEKGIFKLQFSYYLIYLLTVCGVEQLKIMSQFPSIFTTKKTPINSK